MSTPPSTFRSGLAISLQAFLDYKRALNRRYDVEAKTLQLLDRYLAERGLQGAEDVTPCVIDAFVASRPRARPRSYNHLVGVVRRFFAWAVLQHRVTRNPVQIRPRRATSQRLPYVFDLCQAQRLLEQARGLSSPRHPQRGLVYETIFALLYGLGLRVGEVARLTLGDVDRDRQILFIRETKFSKDRLVPMGPNLAARLQRYVEARFQEGDRRREAPLFALSRRGRVAPTTISQTFHAMVPDLNLEVRPGIASPRLHDLRHSFAIGTLLRWYRQGLDPGQRLLHLSTFLGHVDPTSTAVYLTITELLLHEADQRFRAWAPVSSSEGGQP